MRSAWKIKYEWAVGKWNEVQKKLDVVLGVLRRIKKCPACQKEAEKF